MSAGLRAGTNNDGYLQINGTDVLTALSSGRIGVGTTNPSTILELRTASDTQLTLSSSNNTADGRFVFKAASGTEIAGIYMQQNGDTRFYTGGMANERLVIKTGGNVGIGTTNPSNLLTLGASGGPTMRLVDTTSGAFSILIGGSNGDLTFSADHGNTGSSTNIIFSNDGNQERLRINSSGFVGIGTTSPAQPLDIVSNSNGAFAQYLRMRSSNDYGFIGFRSFDGSEDITQIGSQRTAANTGELVLYTNGGTTGQERVRIKSNGTITLRATGGAAIDGYNGDNNQLDVVKLSRMGYDTSYRNLVVGKHFPNSASVTYQSISLNYDPNTNASGNFGGYGNEIFVPNNNQSISYYTSILQPNTTNNGFNSLVRFGPSGQVLTPNQPRFFAKCNSSGYVTTSPIQFTSVDVNIGSGYDSSTYRFTAPIAGTYYFVSTAYVNAGNTVNDGGYIRFRINGNASQYSYAGPGSSTSPNGHITLTLTKIVSLSANDYIDVTFTLYGTGSYYAGPAETTFGGYLMG